MFFTKTVFNDIATLAKPILIICDVAYKGHDENPLLDFYRWPLRSAYRFE
jgi:hypothetical protein